MHFENRTMAQNRDTSLPHTIERVPYSHRRLLLPFLPRLQTKTPTNAPITAINTPPPPPHAAASAVELALEGCPPLDVSPDVPDGPSVTVGAPEDGVPGPSFEAPVLASLVCSPKLDVKAGALTGVELAMQ